VNILLVYPRNPDTYWTFKHALKFVSKKANNIPLGIITVASLLPENWNKKLVDLNVTKLKDRDIQWADYIFISALSIQLDSVKSIIDRCRQLHARTVAGGPLFTEEPEKFPEVDHLIMNEAEITLPEFIRDLEKGQVKHLYGSDLRADISRSPVPDFSLVDLKKYATAGIQYTRGCPYDCEFCDVTALFGRRVRTKPAPQVITELDKLLQSGWKGSVFFVDDNFIGHKKKLKKELLPALIRWMEKNNHPFYFMTETSINLADDGELMQMMVKAGFTKVFVGIETPEETSLAECNKFINHKRDLINSVRTIQRYGIEVAGGFIVGFDSDPPSIFQRQVDFIQNSGIITAMVGLLNAPRLSKLYKRLEGEGRILSSFSGDNTDYSMNFVPAMDREVLMKGYRKIIRDIYSSKPYYQRVKSFLKQYTPPLREQTRVTFRKFMAFLRSVFIIGILKKNRRYYWQLLFWSLRNKPEVFALAVTYSIYGYHFRKVFKGIS
jgi:radical SAM superfamily enzyme YgiQ (UPF0313 family)